MQLIPSRPRKAERVLWFGVLTVLILSGLFMIGLWK